MANATPIHVFVGCSPGGEDIESEHVLEHSARCYTSRPLKFTWMRLSDDPSSLLYGPAWDTREFHTPFSPFRWCVPRLANYTGRALYMDSDMIVLDDLAKLWDLPMGGDTVALMKDRRSSCVTLWDCDAYRRCGLPDVAPQRADPSFHNRMRAAFRQGGDFYHHVGALPSRWNVFDAEADLDLSGVGILHYTNIATQLHLPLAIARLEREGRSHWYNGPVFPHPRADMRDMFAKLYAEADKSRCVPAAPPMVKADLSAYEWKLGTQ